MIVGMVMVGMASLLALPIIGLVLIVLLMLSPRSSLLKSGMATIDAHLRTRSAGQKPSGSSPEAG